MKSKMIFLAVFVAMSFSWHSSADQFDPQFLPQLVNNAVEDGNVLTCDGGNTVATRFEGESYVLQRLALANGKVLWVNMSTDPATGYLGKSMVPDGTETELPLSQLYKTIYEDAPDLFNRQLAERAKDEHWRLVLQGAFTLEAYGKIWSMYSDGKFPEKVSHKCQWSKLARHSQPDVMPLETYIKNAVLKSPLAMMCDIDEKEVKPMTTMAQYRKGDENSVIPYKYEVLVYTTRSGKGNSFAMVMREALDQDLTKITDPKLLALALEEAHKRRPIFFVKMNGETEFFQLPDDGRDNAGNQEYFFWLLSVEAPNAGLAGRDTKYARSVDCLGRLDTFMK